MSKTRKWYRPPTAEEIKSFDGLHCSNIFRQAVACGWRCPSCGRSAIELIRWSEIRGPSMRRRYADQYGMGFTISFARHHCHGKGRFAETLICGDCNSADGAVKQRLKLPPTWSFAPHEIKQFVATTAHSGRVVIDYRKAHEIYRGRS